MTPNNNNKIYTKKANPNATNSELDAKKVIKIPKDNSPYDKIPKRY